MTASETCRVRVKICGITNEADALAAIEAGADALGFNGYPGSKRHIDLAAASAWISRLPPLVTRVAVLVNATECEAAAVLGLPGIDLVQFHGDESVEYCSRFAGRFIKAVRARDRETLRQCAGYGDALLLDAFVPGVFGGSGQPIDLELAAEFVHEHPRVRVILSGGLAPENVGKVVRQAKPYGVDVASGVESEPGRKDRNRMREFMAAVKEFSCE